MQILNYALYARASYMSRAAFCAMNQCFMYDSHKSSDVSIITRTVLITASSSVEPVSTSQLSEIEPPKNANEAPVSLVPSPSCLCSMVNCTKTFFMHFFSPTFFAQFTVNENCCQDKYFGFGGSAKHAVQQIGTEVYTFW